MLARSNVITIEIKLLIIDVILLTSFIPMSVKKKHRIVNSKTTLNGWKWR